MCFVAQGGGGEYALWHRRAGESVLCGTGGRGRVCLGSQGGGGEDALLHRRAGESVLCGTGGRGRVCFYHTPVLKVGRIAI